MSKSVIPLILYRNGNGVLAHIQKEYLKYQFCRFPSCALGKKVSNLTEGQFHNRKFMSPQLLLVIQCIVITNNLRLMVI